MSDLISFDLHPRRRIRLRGQYYRALPVAQVTVMVQLQVEGGEEVVELSRDGFAALLVSGDAAFIDELEDPLSVAKKTAVNLSFLRPHRLYDWYMKLILMRGLFAVALHSPKSQEFRDAFRSAEDMLSTCSELSSISGGKQWSRWTIYHTLLAWRSSGYAMASFQLKSVRYHPWTRRDPRYAEHRALLKKLVNEHPGASIKQLHDLVNRELLASQSQSSLETRNG